MVIPVALLTLVATVGTSIQSAFSWVGYNRDSFGLNVGWRQNQQYFKRSYHMSWVGIAREDLKEMMSVGVHHTGNYLMVSTMVLSSSILAFAVAGFGESCPAFVVFAFYTSGAASVIFLMLSIVFGVKAQGSAYENTVDLLTRKLRPMVPPEEKHDYMQQAQYVEQLGLGSLLRIPGRKDGYGLDRGAEATGSGSAVRAAAPQAAQGAPTTLPADVGELQAPPRLEVFDNAKHAHYLATFGEVVHMWKPHEDYCKLCMGLGTICFAQASSFFVIGKVLSNSGHFLEELLSTMVSIPFVYIMVMIFKDYRRAIGALGAVLPLLLVCSHVSGVLAAALNNAEFRAVAIPLCFLFQFLFWCIALLVARRCAAMPEGAHAHQGAEQLPHAKPTDARDREALGQMDTSGQPVGTQELTDVGVNIVDASDDDDHPGSPSGSCNRQDGPSDFITNQDLLDIRRRAARKHHSAHKALEQALLVCVIMWLGMLAWAVVYYAAEPWLPLKEASAGAVASTQALYVRWPSQLYNPESLACAGGRVFTADRYRVFEVFPGGGSAVEVICTGIEGLIQDIGAACDSRGACHPVVLSDNKVFDCSGVLGKTTAATLARTVGRVAQHLAVVQADPPQLLAMIDSELSQYGWSATHGSWFPEWYLGLLDGGLRGLSVVDGVMMFVRANAAGAAVEVRSIEAPSASRVWHLPPATPAVLSACGPNSSRALLLTKSTTGMNFGSEWAQPRIEQVTLA
eukprot:CAMPEP_0203851064 /NCGR_PEP_ID=MMETSP0359-20131031/7133_1 /ASSEMBLY_ACC=CAM_ASM_000338 /TAXON_ID=268821 /ORGANISM="Scrippsiella Hangoei, Strain SHTV-5" /LENGTH=738 /DNA_ID=CAMNT_0050767039 /DNA_START=56 /DNA_END=2272 /DNA_ORIENTATION=+